MKQFYFFCFSFLLFISVKSQVVTVGNVAIGYTRDVEGSVVLNDGEIITGKLTLPGSFDDKVKVNGKNISSSKIDHIDANHPKSENVYRFVFVELKRYKSNGDLKTWQSKPGWITLAQSGAKADLYNFAPQYRMNADGDLLMQMQHNSAFPFFGMKKNSKEAIMISLSSSDSASEIGTRSFFIKSAKRFFADNSSLVNKIDKKELGIEDIRTIFNIYNQE